MTIPIQFMETTAELEAKFLIEDAKEIPRLRALLREQHLQVKTSRCVVQVDHYLDTPDWKVYAAGWACRWRDAAGTHRVGLKSFGLKQGLIHRREEVEQVAEEFPENGDGIRIEEGPVAEKLDDMGSGELRELFRVRNRRRRFDVVMPGGDVIEFSIDSATITAASSHASSGSRMEFHELELELKEGSDESLQWLAQTVQKSFHLVPSRLSKFERGLQTLSHSPPPTTTRPVPFVSQSEMERRLCRGRLKPGDPAMKLAYRYLLERYEELCIEDPKAWEGLDPEGVHQMRVATRRIRAALRSFKAFLPAKRTRFFKGEFAWLASVLGDVRDLDVYQADYQRYIEGFPSEDAAALANYRQYLIEKRGVARAALCECLTSERYQWLRRSFEAFLRRGAEKVMLRNPKSPSVSPAAVRLIRKSRRQVIREGRAIAPESADETIHHLRIRCKRLRYLYEFFQPVYGKSLRSEIKRLKKLQDVLGEFQDAAVATAQLREYAATVPLLRQKHTRNHLIAIGQLIHSQRAKAVEKREEFWPVWRKFDRKGRTKKLTAILQTRD